MKAIHSPGSDSYILNRARDVLKLYYDPNMSNEDRAAMLDEYSKALRDLPRWAVAHGFNEWVKTGTHRPPPAAIRKLANAELKRYSDLIASRQHEGGTTERPQEREKPLAKETQKILDRSGFTVKRAEQLEKNRMLSVNKINCQNDQLRSDQMINPAKLVKRKHWTETADPDGPQMKALHKARESYGVKKETPP